MKRVPFRESRFAQTFASAKSAHEYVKSHTGWARQAGRIFAKNLRQAGCEPMRILDAGSGSGDTAVILAEAFPQAEVVGLDLSEHMIEVAKLRSGETGLGQRLSFVQGDVLRMPFSDNRFDAVVSQDTLHMLDDPLAMLNECERVLDRQGVLVLRCVRRSWLGLLEQIFRTGLTAAELKELCQRSSLRPWRVHSSLMYLALEARQANPR